MNESIITWIMDRETLQDFIKIKSDDKFNYNLKILHIVNAAENTITYQEAKEMIEEAQNVLCNKPTNK
jgi:hypothetical protein